MNTSQCLDKEQWRKEYLKFESAVSLKYLPPVKSKSELPASAEIFDAAASTDEDMIFFFDGKGWRSMDEYQSFSIRWHLGEYK